MKYHTGTKTNSSPPPSMPSTSPSAAPFLHPLCVWGPFFWCGPCPDSFFCRWTILCTGLAVQGGFLHLSFAKVTMPFTLWVKPLLTVLAFEVQVIVVRHLTRTIQFNVFRTQEWITTSVKCMWEWGEMMLLHACEKVLS